MVAERQRLSGGGEERQRVSKHRKKTTEKRVKVMERENETSRQASERKREGHKERGRDGHDFDLHLPLSPSLSVTACASLVERRVIATLLHSSWKGKHE